MDSPLVVSTRDRGGPHSTAALLLSLLAWTSSGCSLVYVKGPEPDMRPPPPCTASNASPDTDVVLVVLSVAVFTAGAVIYSNESWRNAQGVQVSGVAGMIAGGVGTLVFTPSAIVGYNRTAACRAWYESKVKHASPPALAPSCFLVPERRCPAGGDVPRLCSAKASWESSAVMRGEEPR